MATRIRQKSEKRQANKDTRPHAKVSYLRMSPSKIDVVLDLVRGKKVTEAVAILDNMADEAARQILKVLKSAIANAENNMGKNVETLVLSECWTGHGPLLKRISWRGRGKADQIKKKTAHITIVLDEVVGG